MIIRDQRTWESTDPDYKWTVTAVTTSDRLDVYTDDIPTPQGARAFANALLEAAAWREERP